MRTGIVVGGAMLAALLATPASAQTGQERIRRDAPRGREAPAARQAPPGRVGFGADNDAQPGGVPGNAPFNNQLRKFTDPLGANGSR